MPLDPEMISASTLPVGMRGYRREETEELLRRVASDYVQAISEREALSEQVRQLRQLIEDLAVDKALLRSELKEAESELAARPGLSSPTPPRDDGDIARSTAQRERRAIREAARLEREAILVTARQQAAEIERRAHAKAKRADAEVQRLLRLQEQLRRQLRGMLESMLREVRPSEGQAQRPALGDDLSRSLPRPP